MRSFFLIYLIVSLITTFKRECRAERLTTTNYHSKTNDLTNDKRERRDTEVLGLSRSIPPPIIISERSLAVEQAFKLLQSFLYDLLERIRGLQFKVDNLITQPLVQFFRNGGRMERDHKNDHIDCDIDTLGLTAYKLKMVYDILGKSILHNQALHRRANATHLNINPHLIYRYLCAADWSKKYNGRRVFLFLNEKNIKEGEQISTYAYEFLWKFGFYEDAILDTVEWRESFGINSINPSDIAHLVKNGLGYTGGFDKHGRAIVYVKIGRNVKLEDNATYQKLLMYTVERADRMSVQNGCGEFVAVIDLEGFKWSNSLPIPMIKEAVTLLKRHYPYRLGGVFIINGSSTFTLLWNMIKPIMPRKTLLKTFVINKRNIARTMGEKLGRDFIEECYGGVMKEDHDDVTKYFAQGYWG